MKKLFLILVIGFLCSCNNSKTSQNETDSKKSHISITKESPKE